jgi:large subunit ribosomal protein L30
MASLSITQVKSANGTTASQRATLESLGLRRIGHTVERPQSPQLLGMVHTVRHLIAVEEREDA